MNSLIFCVLLVVVLILSGCSQTSSNTKTDAELTEIVEIGDLSFTLLDVVLDKMNTTYGVTTEPNGDTPAKVYLMMWSFKVTNNGKSVKSVSSCGILLFENGRQYDFAPDMEETRCKEFTILPGATVPIISSFLFSDYFMTSLAMPWEDVPGSKILYMSKQSEGDIKYVIDKKDISYTGINYVDPQNNNIVESINKTFIISSCEKENNRYVVSNINLWSSPKMISVKETIIRTCGGLKVNAYEKSIYNNQVVYHIRTTDFKDGWILESLIKPDGICKTNQDCEFNSVCKSVQDCDYRDTTKNCLVSENICVECITTRDCSGSDVCDNTTHKCVECLTNNDCPKPSVHEKEVCNPTTQKCMDCLSNKDCPSDSFFENQKFCYNYTFEGEYAAGYCVECLDNYDCKEDEYCDTEFSIYSSCEKRK